MSSEVLLVSVRFQSSIYPRPQTYTCTLPATCLGSDLAEIFIISGPSKCELICVAMGDPLPWVWVCGRKAIHLMVCCGSNDITPMAYPVLI